MAWPLCQCLAGCRRFGRCGGLEGTQLVRVVGPPLVQALGGGPDWKIAG